MTSNTTFIHACHVFEATPDHVEKAFKNLNRDMNPEFIHIFLDKLTRYAQKPDRALFLVEYLHNVIAFATIINESPPPDDFPKEKCVQLRDHACGTGLMVLPKFRRKGVASLLLQQWKKWAIAQNLTGIWVVTRQMGEWYKQQFDYSYLGETIRGGVKKTVLLTSDRVIKS